MRLMQLFKHKKVEEAPVADTRTEAPDHEYRLRRLRDLQQEGPMIPLRWAGFQKVPKWCHAPGKAGKAILCPVCAAVLNVYHFGWTTLPCPSCNTKVEKYDWYLAPAAALPPEE
jgi:hypothetical protein